MRHIFATFVALLASLSLALGRDISTLTGQVYRNVTVTRIEKLGIGISHRDGIAFLDFSILPADIRREFSYSEQAYAAALEAQKRQQENAEAQKLTLEAARQAEVQRQRETATAAAAIATQEAQRAAIAARDYASRGYADRNYTNRYPPSAPPATPTPIAPSSTTVSSSRMQCTAMTKKGFRCSRMAASGSNRCWQH